MQLDPIEVYDLFRLTRRVGPFQDDPSLTQSYYDVQGRILRGERVTDEDLAFLRQALRSIQRHDPKLADFIRLTVLTPTNRSQYDLWIEKNLKPTTISLKKLLRAIFASAPLSRVMMRHNRALLRIYQQKGKLNANLAHRHILPIRKIVYTPQEEQAYHSLESYCTELSQQIASANQQQAIVSTGFYLSFLRRRFASSLHAIAETLRRRRERVRATLEHVLAGSAMVNQSAPSDTQALTDDWEQEETESEIIDHLLRNRSEQDLKWELSKLEEMLESHVYDVDTTSSKMQALLGYVENRRDAEHPGRIRQMVIFTQFWDTLEDIVRRFRQVESRLLIGTYSGRGGQYTNPETRKLIGTERDEIKHRFLRGQIDILVCTDAAAEGLNLQTADFLINFDLPWNPAKVEQRIGRIDRIGQRHVDIHVQNLCYLGSVEEIVYGRLLSRLGDMISVVGEQQISMLPVTEEDFRRLADGEINETQLEQEAKERIAITQRRVRETELTGEEIYEIYQRIEESQATTQLPVSLEDIWEVLTAAPYLKTLGCKVESNLGDSHDDGFVLAGIPGVADGTVLTVNRSIFDRGIEALGSNLRFATYGEASFDALLETSANWKTPSCIRRIAVKPAGLQNDYVAFVVAVSANTGPELRLVRSLGCLEGLLFDQTREITEAELAPFITQLKCEADAEFKLNGHVAVIEADNILSGRAQAALALGTAFGFITGRQKVGSADNNFWKELDASMHQFDQRITAGSGFRIMYIPGCFEKFISAAYTLFEVKRKVTDDTLWIERAPPILANAGFEAAARSADALRRKKSELSTDMALARIKADMERLSK